jgi:glycosyltransferase involved in cell wall biosynthesis
MNTTSPTAPVTAVLFCYRQQDVVEAAVRSIFEQTVQPVEIILSDDASPDGSYEVLCRLADQYTGPAKLIVRKTEGSSGWFAHINTCMALASHDQVIIFAGDDISLPNRVERFAEEISKHPESRLIWSMMERMTPDGKATGKVMGTSSFTPGRLRGGVGASQCWHKELITAFGELPPVQAAEDIVLPFRASLLGGLRHIPEPLVLWRDRDYRELTREQLERTYEVRATQFRINASKVVEADLVSYLEKHPEQATELEGVKNRLAREIVSVTAEHDVISAPSRAGRFAALLPRLNALGFKRSRRLWQDQILGLPAYLDSAYPRAVRRWLPRLSGLTVGVLFYLLADLVFLSRITIAFLLVLVGMETTRMLLRWVAKFRWSPA